MIDAIGVETLIVSCLLVSFSALFVGFVSYIAHVFYYYKLLLHLWKRKRNRFCELVGSNDWIGLYPILNPIGVTSRVWKYAKDTTDNENDKISNYKKKMLLTSNIGVPALIVFIIFFMTAMISATLA